MGEKPRVLSPGRAELLAQAEAELNARLDAGIAREDIAFRHLQEACGRTSEEIDAVIQKPR